MKYRLQIVAPGPRPPCYQVAEHLWGVGCTIDSDGNSSAPRDRYWTELTICLRSNPNKRVDIDPISHDPLILEVCSTEQLLCQRATDFIIRVSGGEVRRA